MSNSLEFIENLGFKEVGKWEWDKDEDGEILCPLGEREQKQKEWVYAFVVDGVVMYIGQTEKTLKKRMGDYEKPGKSQDRNHRGNKQIKDALENGVEVFVYALQNDEIKRNKEAENLIAHFAGLEKGLIKEMKLGWNVSGQPKLLKKIKLPGYEFNLIGEWKLDGGKIFVDLDKTECEKKGWIYFLLSDDKKIIHVGTTDRTLKKIMDNYKGGHKEGASIRIYKDIKAVLEKNVKVFVYAYQFNVAAIDDKTKNIIKYGIERALEDELNEEEKDEQNEDE